jgi:hypothetical protein
MEVTLRIFLLKSVSKWLKNTKSVSKQKMIDTALEIKNGSVEADLGGNVYKKRIASTSGRGKSSGSRLLIAFKEDANLFFVEVFDKNQTDNISSNELKILKEAAKDLLAMSDKNLNLLVSKEKLIELTGEDNNE